MTFVGPIHSDDLNDFVRALLGAVGADTDDARLVAKQLVDAEADLGVGLLPARAEQDVLPGRVHVPEAALHRVVRVDRFGEPEQHRPRRSRRGHHRRHVLHPLLRRRQVGARVRNAAAGPPDSVPGDCNLAANRAGHDDRVKGGNHG